MSSSLLICPQPQAFIKSKVCEDMLQGHSFLSWTQILIVKCCSKKSHCPVAPLSWPVLWVCGQHKLDLMGYFKLVKALNWEKWKSRCLPAKWERKLKIRSIHLSELLIAGFPPESPVVGSWNSPVCFSLTGWGGVQFEDHTRQLKPDVSRCPHVTGVKKKDTLLLVSIWV